MGLPIHRLDGSPRPVSSSTPAELDRWLDEKLHEHDRDPRPYRKRGRGTNAPTLPRLEYRSDRRPGGRLGHRRDGDSGRLIAPPGQGPLGQRRRRPRGSSGCCSLPTGRRRSVLFLKTEKIIPRSTKLASLRPLLFAVRFCSKRTLRARMIGLKDYAAGEDAWEHFGPAPAIRVTVLPGIQALEAVSSGRPYRRGCFPRPGWGTRIEVGAAQGAWGTSPPRDGPGPRRPSREPDPETGPLAHGRLMTSSSTGTKSQ